MFAWLNPVLWDLRYSSIPPLIELDDGKITGSPYIFDGQIRGFPVKIFPPIQIDPQKVWINMWISQIQWSNPFPNVRAVPRRAGLRHVPCCALALDAANDGEEVQGAQQEQSAQGLHESEE